MTYASEGQNYDAMAWRRMITLEKVYKTVRKTVSGVTCDIYQGANDAAADTKLAAIQKGVKRVVDAGYAFPNGIRFYTSSIPGFQSVAYHRDLAAGSGTNRISVVLLGASSVDTRGMVGRQGVAEQVANGSAETYCEAVVVHELAHNLHEQLSGDFFWTPGANEPPNVNLAMDISQYAATNKKEVVAEYFTGRRFGLTYSSAVDAMYGTYQGP